MKKMHLERAARQAIVLAADLDARLPAWCAVPPEDLFAAAWPLACRLETYIIGGGPGETAGRRCCRWSRPRTR